MNINSYLKDGIPTVSPEELSKAQGFVLIDVRSSEEFIGELGHIESAQLWTLGAELDAQLKGLEKNTPIIFICRSGARSGRATLAALEAGFSKVYNMEGGMMKWNSLGMKIIR